MSLGVGKKVGPRGDSTPGNTNTNQASGKLHEGLSGNKEQYNLI